MANAKVKRVLMIGLTPPLEGGSERHIYELSTRIPDCQVLTQRGSSCSRTIELPILNRTTFVRNISFLFVTMLYAFWITLRPRKKQDVIHIHENLLYFLVPLLRLRYEVVVTVHGINGFSYYDNKFLWLFFKQGLTCASHLIAVSKVDETLLKRYFSRVTYIPNGVDISLYKNKSSRVEQKIGFIGRIHEQKGIVYLLQAFTTLKSKFPKLKLEIIGEVNDYAKELQKKFPSKDILWRGFVKDRSIIVRSLQSSYVIVLPSLWEGLPLTLLESLASRRPLIISDIPSFKSVVNDEALYFKGGDVKDLAGKIELLLKNSTLASKYGSKGRSLASEYEWDNLAFKLRQVYSSV